MLTILKSILMAIITAMLWNWSNESDIWIIWQESVWCKNIFELITYSYKLLYYKILWKWIIKYGNYFTVNVVLYHKDFLENPKEKCSDTWINSFRLIYNIMNWKDIKVTNKKLILPYLNKVFMIEDKHIPISPDADIEYRNMIESYNESDEGKEILSSRLKYIKKLIHNAENKIIIIHWKPSDRTIKYYWSYQHIIWKTKSWVNIYWFIDENNNKIIFMPHLCNDFIWNNSSEISIIIKNMKK